MKLILSLVMSLACMLILVGCGSPGTPQPIKVLENPTTGERARFFPEIAYKIPADYTINPSTSPHGPPASNRQASLGKSHLPTIVSHLP